MSNYILSPSDILITTGNQVMEAEPEAAHYHGSALWVPLIISLIVFVATSMFQPLSFSNSNSSHILSTPWYLFMLLLSLHELNYSHR